HRAAGQRGGADRLGQRLRLRHGVFPPGRGAWRAGRGASGDLDQRQFAEHSRRRRTGADDAHDGHLDDRRYRRQARAAVGYPAQRAVDLDADHPAGASVPLSSFVRGGGSAPQRGLIASFSGAVVSKADLKDRGALQESNATRPSSLTRRMVSAVRTVSTFSAEVSTSMTKVWKVERS